MRSRFRGAKVKSVTSELRQSSVNGKEDAIATEIDDILAGESLTSLAADVTMAQVNCEWVWIVLQTQTATGARRRLC